MKRVALHALLALCLASTVRAFPFFMPLSHLPRAVANPMEAERAGRPPRPVSGMEFILSTFDKPIIDKFREAWRRAGNGTTPRESVIMILRMADGSYSARMPNPTNEYKRFTFAWHPATIAIVHTHPNASPPRPEDDDIKSADRFNVPVFTLTQQGMFVYDPATRKTSRVLEGLNWLEDSAWQKMQAHLASR